MCEKIWCYSGWLLESLMVTQRELLLLRPWDWIEMCVSSPTKETNIYTFGEFWAMSGGWSAVGRELIWINTNKILRTSRTGSTGIPAWLTLVWLSLHVVGMGVSLWGPCFCLCYSTESRWGTGRNHFPTMLLLRDPTYSAVSVMAACGSQKISWYVSTP